MSKRMIDADALFKHIKQILKTAISEREYYSADKNVYLSRRNPPKSALKTLKTVLFEIEDAFVKLPRKLCLQDSSVDDKELAAPAPESQESIFDADGWCRDLKAIPKNTLIDLAVQCVKDKSMNREVNYTLNDDNNFYSSDYDHYLDDTYEFGYVIVAWRPLPTLPKEA